MNKNNLALIALMFGGILIIDKPLQVPTVESESDVENGPVNSPDESDDE
jgi:hypothetical protein